jgi:hypothetical protein
MLIVLKTYSFLFLFSLSFRTIFGIQSCLDFICNFEQSPNLWQLLICNCHFAFMFKYYSALIFTSSKTGLYFFKYFPFIPKVRFSGVNSLQENKYFATL